MTDEEMAEEYVKSNNIEWELECNRTSPIGEVIQAYLAGLEAGRPKWHKVEDEDLPKEPTPVLTLSSDDSLDECVYIPCEGFKNPVFSTWYYPVAWIEKEKIFTLDAKGGRTMDIKNALLLEENAQLKKELEELTITNDYQRVISDKNERISFLEAQLAEAKEIMNIAIKGIKRGSVGGGYERPFVRGAEMLFDLFFEKAEQFLEEN